MFKCGWHGNEGYWLETVEGSTSHYEVPRLGPEGDASEKTEAGVEAGAYHWAGDLGEEGKRP